MSQRRILVLQLCRLGDLIQTTPMLRALRASQPDAHVTLVVLDGFAHAPIPRRLYDDLLAFPFGQVTALTAAVPSRWQEALREVRAFVRGVGLEPYDQIVNVTGSTLSNLLATVIPSRDVQGGIVAADRTRVVRGPWMTYFWASIVARAQGCFNVVDVMTRSAGLQPDGRGPEIEVSAAARERMGSWLAERRAPGTPLIAVQVGASDERKRWPRHRVAAALDLLPAEWGEIVFVGTKDERCLVDEARQALKRPSLDASGSTSVEELGALLGECNLLLTNDTGTMHVAAAVDTRVIDLSTGPVYVHETGPYGTGHLAVEPTIACFPCAPGSVCSHLSCRDDFAPHEIAAIIGYALGHGPLPRPERARVLEARTTQSGRLEYVPLWLPSTTAADRVRHAAARVWEQTLDERWTRAVPETDLSIRRDLDHALATIVDALQTLSARAEHGRSLAAGLGAASARQQTRRSEGIQKCLAEIGRIGQRVPECQTIAAFLAIAVQSITEPSLDVIAVRYRTEFGDAALRARMLAGILLREACSTGTAGDCAAAAS